MGDECMDMFNNVEKEISLIDLMSSNTKFDTVFNRLVYFEMERAGSTFKNEIRSIINNKFEANTAELAKWTNIMNEVMDEMIADQRLRFVQSIDGHIQNFDSDGDRVVDRMQLISDIIGICHETMTLAKSCLEAFENRLSGTEVLGFDNNRLPSNKFAKDELLYEHEVTNAVIAINDLRFAVGVSYFAHQINLWYDWDWKKLYDSGATTVKDAGALAQSKKETISLMSSWNTFKVQLGAAKDWVSTKTPPAEQPSIQNSDKAAQTDPATSDTSKTTDTT